MPVMLASLMPGVWKGSAARISAHSPHGRGLRILKSRHSVAVLFGNSGGLFAVFYEALPVMGQLVFIETRPVRAERTRPAFGAFLEADHTFFGAVRLLLISGCSEVFFFLAHDRLQ